jgi:hypothetical protein
MKQKREDRREEEEHEEIFTSTHALLAQKRTRPRPVLT